MKKIKIKKEQMRHDVPTTQTNLNAKIVIIRSMNMAHVNN